MIVLQLTKECGNPITLFLSNNFCVTPSASGHNSLIVDGVHNNGGWKVMEEYNDILRMVDNQL